MIWQYRCSHVMQIFQICEGFYPYGHTCINSEHPSYILNGVLNIWLKKSRMFPITVKNCIFSGHHYFTIIANSNYAVIIDIHKAKVKVFKKLFKSVPLCAAYKGCPCRVLGCHWLKEMTGSDPRAWWECLSHALRVFFTGKIRTTVIINHCINGHKSFFYELYCCVTYIECLVFYFRVKIIFI